MITSLLFVIFKSSPIIDRLFNPNNLSGYVYRQHTKSAFLSIYENYSMGQGINHYERSFFGSVKKNLIKKLESSGNIELLNYNDGSNNLNKLIGEFGILGILLILFLLYKIFKSLNKSDDLFLFCSFLFITSTFLRAAGYFNGGYIFSILVLVFFKRLK